jgi:fimbrial isopeptide formation D2 family protein/uncharacterized repeat protein (TIGR01451 family)
MLSIGLFTDLQHGFEDSAMRGLTMVGESILGRAPRSLFVTVALLVSLLVIIVMSQTIGPALAGGSPDLAVAVELEHETLHGGSTPVSVGVENNSGVDGFNLSGQAILPPGVSYVSGDVTPVQIPDAPNPGFTTLYVENISDSPSGTSESWDFVVLHDPTAYGVLDTFTIDVAFHANTDPRQVPMFDSVTGEPSNFTGSGEANDTTLVVAFVVEKSEPSPEAELMRGLHDHQTVYTITVTNNPTAQSTGIQVDDWLSAGIEFLGCGTEDNSSVGDEYPGSGPINPGNAPPTSNCLVPDTVETVENPSGLPAGVYTHVVWGTAVTGITLPPGGVATMEYVAAIPMFENTMVWDGETPDTTGSQGSNIDNNNGFSTAEGSLERSYRNYAVAVGLYSGDDTVYTHDGSYEVFAEDLAIDKTVDTRVVGVGQTSTWSILVRSSEYGTLFDAITLVDTVPDGNCPGTTPGCAAGSPSQPYGSAVEQADGTWTISWDLPAMGRSEIQTLDYETEVLGFYQQDFADDSPVVVGDTWRNDALLFGEADGNPVTDASFDRQRTPLITIVKEVAQPVSPLDSCGNGSALTWLNDAAPPYSPGDRVCWRIRATTPQASAQDLVIQDYLPPGFIFELWEKGANNTLDDSEIGFDEVSSQLLQWSLGGADTWTPAGTVFEAVISSISGDAADFADEDVVGNLMKVRYTDSNGDAFGARDEENITFTSPIVSITKEATHTEVLAGDTVVYTLTIDDIGTGTASEVEVWDIIPPEFSCTDIAAISDGGVCTDGTISWLIPQIQDQDSAGLTYELTVPASLAPGTLYTNNAGVRSYTGTLNHGDGETLYYPENNIDPSLAALENAPAADDDWTIFAPEAMVLKTRSTSVDEPGNNGNQHGTIGETAFFTVTATIPAGTTVYDAKLSDDVNAALFGYGNDVVATVNGVEIPSPLDPGFTIDDTDGHILITFPATYTVAGGGDDAIVEFTFTATLLDAAANVRTVQSQNQGKIVWDDQNGKTQTRRDNGPIRVVEPDLHISKSDDTGDGFVDPGQIVTFTLVISNPKSDNVSTAHDLVVTDIVPQSSPVPGNTLTPLGDGGIPVSANGDNVPPNDGAWSQDTSTITWNLSGLEPTGLTPNADTSLTYEAVVGGTLVEGTVLTNEATVKGSSLVGAVDGERDADSPNGGPGSGYQDTATDTVFPPAARVTKTVTPQLATIGEKITYVAEFVFPKDLTTFDGTLIDQLPDGITVSGIDVGPPDMYTVQWNCVDDLGSSCGPGLNELIPLNNAVGWWLGDIPPDDVTDRTWTVEYVARIDNTPTAQNGAVLSNRIAGYANTSSTGMAPPTVVPDPDTFDHKTIDAIADVGVIEPDVTLVKEVDDAGVWVEARRALPNESLDYRITLTNAGTSPAYDMVVNDTIATFSGDAMLLGEVDDGSGYTVTDGDPSDGTLAWWVPGPIAPGDSVTIVYTVDVWDADTADENPTGPEITNVAVGGEYFGVADTERDGDHPEWYRTYVTQEDGVDIELDLASVGDYVWFDVNGDGGQASEPPIGGVEITVTYLGPGGVVGGGDDESHVAVTDASGIYVVEDLPGGQYLAEVTGGVPGGLSPSYDLEHGIASPDATSAFALGQAEDRTDVDWGFNGVNSLGDLVWWDRESTGTPDTSTPGIADVELTVRFFGFDGIEGTPDDVVYPTLTTDTEGVYGLDSLPIGTYRVTVDTSTLPVGMFATHDLDGGSDSTAIGDLSFAGEHRTDFDFGYTGLSFIGDRVWFDLNRDGIQDPDEPGLAGVDVAVTWPGPNGIPGDGDDIDIIVPTVSDGKYRGVGLNPGDYKVAIVTATLPAGMSQTYDPDGILDDMTIVTVGLASEIEHIDFGYAGDGGIGDTVWWDNNGDGAEDVGEPGLPNVQVKALWWGSNDIPGDFDDVTWSTITESDGRYSFGDLPAGTFDVTVFGALVNDMDPTYDLDGGLDNTVNLALALGEDRSDVDFGYNGTNAIGDAVWYDINGDALEDDDEPGVPDVALSYVWLGINGIEGDSDDVGLPDLVTDADGRYDFTGIPNGNHRVTVLSGVPLGMVQTFDEDGGLDGTTVISDLGGDMNHDTADFGYTGTGTIGNSVWWDLNGDGVQGLSEPEWSGVTVTVTWAAFDGLLGTADDVVHTTVTASKWSISDLPAGLYQVAITREDLPVDVYQTYSPDGVLDSTADLSIAAGETNLDQDFGYRGGQADGPTAAIGDLVWLDLNRDETSDEGEPGVDSVIVTVVYLGADGAPGGGDDIDIPLLTSVDGSYAVDGLVGGAYRVELDASTLPAGSIPHSDLDGGDPAETSVMLATGVANLDVDFGLIGSDIGDTIWIDTNGDGVKNASETGIPNVPVRLVDNADGSIVAAVTDADGFYIFQSVLTGNYTVIVDAGSIPDGLEQVYSRDGNLDGATSVDIEGASDQLDIDFGYEKNELPNTGLDTVRLLAAGVLLLLAGAFTVWLTRRRGLE